MQPRALLAAPLRGTAPSCFSHEHLQHRRTHTSRPVPHVQGASSKASREVIAPKHSKRESLAPKHSRESIAPKKSTRDSLAPKQSSRESPAPKQSTRESLAPKQGARESLAPKQSKRESLVPKQSKRESQAPKQSMSKHRPEIQVEPSNIQLFAVQRLGCGQEEARGVEPVVCEQNDLHGAMLFASSSKP